MAEGSSRGGSSRGRRSSGSGGRGSGSRSSGGRSSSGQSSSRSSSSRSARASSTGGRTSSRSSSKSSSSRSGASTSQKRKAAAKKGGQARARQQKAQKGARRATRSVEGAEFAGKSVAELRDALAKGVVAPLNLVMISRERIEEVLDDAVKRGRVRRDDAQDLVQSIVQRGRKQTNDVLSDLEQLLGRGGEVVDSARRRGASAAKRGRTRVREAVDPALAQADSARRVAGVGPNFPILGYDDLTAAQVQGRLDGLTAAELRKVRDYERRNANRKSVLDRVEAKIS
jgi:polyhydroxyalkanoate synthesis regulator phasin